jgi:hypothetical protein
MDQAAKRTHLHPRVRSGKRSLRAWLPLAGVAVLILALGSAWWLNNYPAAGGQAPEAGRVQSMQASMPFQILIPAFMPRGFNRAGMQIKTSDTGPGGEAMAQLDYHTNTGESVFLREWVPIQADKEILATSKPIQTKWGQGWLLVEGQDMIALWVDIGPTRVSVYTPDPQTVKQEQILEMANTLGPPSNQQVFSFVVNPPQIQVMAPPPPVVIPIDAKGVQEVTLVVTPGGYSPLRFSVKKGVPVRLIFRQLGQVGCGNELIFPADPQNPSSLKLASDQDEKTLEFTPQQSGVFTFYCSHQMYRGEMTVRDN